MLKMYSYHLNVWVLCRILKECTNAKEFSSLEGRYFKEIVDFQINDTGEGKDKQLSGNNINLVCRVNVINMV